jgi:predicted ATP-grasp superfamily ATP-dependent carboligase
MDRSNLVMIAAASGRALAASARRGGYVPLVADGFGDQDTLAAAAGHVRIDLGRPVNGDRLIAALASLATTAEPAGIVYGSGFEDRADLLTRIGERWTLLGNAPETVARLKDPAAFAAICRAASVPHVETSLEPPLDNTGWLVKRIGGAGGSHIRPAGDGAVAGDGVYFQRRANGTPISALLLGDGRRVMVLGFSSQWPAATPRQPFRYGGAVRPAALAEDVKQAMTAAVERLVTAVPLLGLNSADFLVEGNEFHLLEINPRPGATFDLFEAEGSSLFALHLAACAGTLPARAPVFEGAMAGAIVYAERDVAAMPALQWPDWTTDRPVAGSAIKTDDPLCSVYARAATAPQAKQLLAQRTAMVRAMLDPRLS